jgi:hypothetical protein
MILKFILDHGTPSNDRAVGTALGIPNTGKDDCLEELELPDLVTKGLGRLCVFASVSSPSRRD